MSHPIHVGILGGSGYGAAELLRLLTQHPSAEVVSVTSSSSAGESITSLHPHLRGFYDFRTTESLDLNKLLAAEQAVVFSALPHATSGAMIDRLLQAFEKLSASEKVRIIDLSGDLRLRDPANHVRLYPESPLLPDRRRSFVYGMPELFREQVQTARWVANPGCLATASILAAAPLVEAPFAGTVAIDAKTGSSGSGRALKDTTHHPTRHADFRAYKPLNHPHEAEILQAWGDPRSMRVKVSFVPQSMDVSRGIFATVHLKLAESTTTQDLHDKYAAYYETCPFVRVVHESPTLQDVVGSNFCDVSVVCRGRQVIAMAAIDNLIKGMAGTAIQNMNLMCGLPETAGLWAPALRPI